MFTGVCRSANARSPIITLLGPSASATLPRHCRSSSKVSAMFSLLPTASLPAKPASGAFRARDANPTARRATSASARQRVIRLAALAALAAFGAIVLSTRFADANEVSPGTNVFPAGSVSSAVVVIVQPGETLWSVARALQPSGDVRPLVSRLTRDHGGSGVRAGDRLSIPSDIAESAPTTPSIRG